MMQKAILPNMILSMITYKYIITLSFQALTSYIVCSILKWFCIKKRLISDGWFVLGFSGAHGDVYD